MVGKTIFTIVVVLIAIIVIRVLRNRRRHNRLMENTENQTNTVNNNIRNTNVPPPLPNTRRPSTPSNHRRGSTNGAVATPMPLPPLPQANNRESNIYGYPCCPIHKCRNRPGESQKIYWIQAKQMWKCCYGHYYYS